MSKKISLDSAKSVTGSRYPVPFDKPCEKRFRRRLGDVAGLTQFGVNLTRLPAGCWSSQRHWHTAEDEFIYILEGEAEPSSPIRARKSCAPATAQDSRPESPKVIICRTARAATCCSWRWVPAVRTSTRPTIPGSISSTRRAAPASPTRTANHTRRQNRSIPKAAYSPPRGTGLKGESPRQMTRCAQCIGRYGQYRGGGAAFRFASRRPDFLERILDPIQHLEQLRHRYVERGFDADGSRLRRRAGDQHAAPEQRCGEPISDRVGGKCEADQQAFPTNRGQYLGVIALAAPSAPTIPVAPWPPPGRANPPPASR